jgi:hypothetical protein
MRRYNSDDSIPALADNGEEKGDGHWPTTELTSTSPKPAKENGAFTNI